MRSRKLILIAHYDAAGHLSRDWCELIIRLRREQFAEILFVSTHLHAERYREVFGDLRVIIRENVGYDFYSWREAIVGTALHDYPEAILINSSFHVVDAARFCGLLREPMPADARFRGLTVSWQKAFHAQSFFMQFSGEVLRSPVFMNFWAGMRPISDRETVIDTYELGISRELSRDFPIEPIFQVGDYEKFLLLRRVLRDPSVINAGNLQHAYDQLKQHFNPSILLWESILFRYGIVKQQVVRDNPFGFAIDDLQRYIRFSAT